MTILMMLILPIHEHGICFHLSVSSLISFFSVVQFSEYSSFTSLVRFIPRCLIFIVAIANEIFFLIFDSDLSWLVCKNTFELLILTLNPAVLPNSLISWSSFGVESWGILCTLLRYLQTSSFPIWMPFISFSCLITVARTSNAILSRSGESGHLCLVPDLSKNF